MQNGAAKGSQAKKKPLPSERQGFLDGSTGLLHLARGGRALDPVFSGRSYTL